MPDTFWNCDGKIVAAGSGEPKLCPSDPCAGGGADCCSGATPVSINAEIDALVDEDCGECTGAAGDLDDVTFSCGQDAPDACSWSTTLSHCAGLSANVGTYQDFTDQYVAFGITFDDGSYVEWRKSVGPPDSTFDCEATHELAYAAGESNSTKCDWTGSKVILNP